MRVTTILCSSLVVLTLATQAFGNTTCQSRCGDDDHTDGCQCNTLCDSYGDCCSDYESICLSCDNRCGENYLYSKPCQCNNECSSHGNCCEDYDILCGGSGGSLTDDDIRELTEELLTLDENNVGSLITYDIQGKTSSSDTTDEAPNKLFTSVPPEALQPDTIVKMMALRDNYHPDVSITETNDAAELAEIDDFITAIMATSVMQRTEEFLNEYNLISGDFKEILTKIWFNLYSRSRATRSSSGAEHVLMGEIKNNKVSGFHNWISYYLEEDEGTLDYKGYIDLVDLGDKGIVLANRMEWMGYPKSIGSMFIGTSPELELATFTTCFYARPNGSCSVQMNNQRFAIVTYTMDFGGETLVGTAYPDV